MTITNLKIKFLLSSFTSRYLIDNSVSIDIRDLRHHHNMLINIMVQNDVPLMLSALVTRMNRLKTINVPKDRDVIYLPNEAVLNEILETINDLD